VSPSVLRWLVQRREDVPAGLCWLADGEAEAYAALRSARRRDDYLLGRWTAKRAISAYLGTLGWAGALADIEVRAASDGAPEALVEGARAPAGVSLSHRAGLGLCVVGPSGVAFGADVELIEPRSRAFVESFFAAEEQEAWRAAPAGAQDALACLLWSAKESALKALREGLRVDTREVVVRLGGEAPGGWGGFAVESEGGAAFEGVWRRLGVHVATVSFSRRDLSGRPFSGSACRA
jgi:4'-phosphopantetheinyl transferase